MTDHPRPVMAVWLVLCALITRAAVLGDVSYFNDESFYYLAGLRLHDGMLPYVDVWDRKGPGLFATYWLITFLPGGVLAAHLVAALCAAATAMVVAAIARLMTGWQGAALAATLYLASMPLFGGAGGQTPVFYNVLMAGAVLLVLGARGDLARGCMPVAVPLSMAMAGLAITFKQTAAFESAFLGLWVLIAMSRGGATAAQVGRRAVLMVIAGAVPFLAAGASFAILGHFGEFWHAMVLSNLSKTYDPFGDHWLRLQKLALMVAPVALVAVFGLLTTPRQGAWDGRRFVALWIAAALVGFGVLPNFYDHYVLPLLVPLCVAAAPALDRDGRGRIAAIAVLSFLAVASPMFDFAGRHAASARVEGLARRVLARDPHPRVLVYEGPMSLYTLTGSTPPSPLLDNFHLYFPAENNTSHLDTAREMRRILAWRPTVVLVGVMPPGDENLRTRALVDAYTAHCRAVDAIDYTEVEVTTRIIVYGDCQGA